MNAQILQAGTDRDYAAALDWITQTAASGTTLAPPPDEGPATEALVAALLPAITSEHATVIVAQQIRQTLSAARPAPAEGGAPADHGTFPVPVGMSGLSGVVPVRSAYLDTIESVATESDCGDYYTEIKE